MELYQLRRKRTKIVVESRLRPQNIDCFYSQDRIPFNGAERSYIDKAWSEEITRKPSIFDGRLFHVNRQEFVQSRLILYTCISSFKEWVGTKNNKFKERFCENRVVRPLSVGSMIITSDDKWIIGRRHKTYDFEGQYTLLAGYMDPDTDIINSKPDPFFSVRREIAEETGINNNQDIDDVIGLGQDGTEQPYLAFKAQLRISYDALTSNVPLENEFTKLEAYQYEKRTIKEFITSNYRKLTPHTLAHLLMSYDEIEP
jgi:8-oxo-dGTP pyrophosphatase MutT (NUDIX family)